MNPLFGHIREMIEKGGPMNVARYMDLALQHPEHGYYQSGDPLGREGDFVTAPEISQMFGEMLGLWCAETWRAMGKPKEFALLELGPGRGTLMQDALRATVKIQDFHAAVKLHLLESNRTLRALQHDKLGSFAPAFIDNLDRLPALPLIAIANEFFDAMPIRQFEATDKGWCERLINVDGKELVFLLSPPDPSFSFLIRDYRHGATPGTVEEVSPQALASVRQLTRHVARHGGAALIVDYGYAAPSGRPTLQATSSHSHADVLERPGEVDLTAHVDFGALRQMAQAQGAAVMGPVSQGEFLRALGIEMRAMQLKHGATPEQAAEIEASLARLVGEEDMGVLFKVMALAAPQLDALAGF